MHYDGLGGQENGVIDVVFFLSNLCAWFLLVAEKRECKYCFLGPVVGAITVWVYSEFSTEMELNISINFFSPVIILCSGHLALCL